MRFLYYFASGRLSRIHSEGEYPKEMFYGADATCDALILEYKHINTSSFFERFITKLIKKVSIGVFSVREWKRAIEIKVGYDVLLSTSIELSLAVCLLNKLTGRRKKAVYFNMLADSYSFSILDKKFIQYIRKQLVIISISGMEYALITEKLPNVPHYLIEFGIDTDFWISSKVSAKTTKSYYFSVGQDKFRDWELLIEVFAKTELELMLLNNVESYNGLPENIIHIHGGYSRNDIISDTRLRDLYGGAKAVVVPLMRCNKPAGQSVCLQAMAMKIPVVLTKTAGIWSDMLIDKENCILTEPGSVRSFTEAIAFIENNNQEVEKIVENAYRLVTEHYTYKRFKRLLFDTINFHFHP